MHKILSTISRLIRKNRGKLLYRRGFRTIDISFPHAIGHLALEVDALIKDRILSGQPTLNLVLHDIKDKFANRCLVEYFRNYITVTEDDPFRFLAGEPHWLNRVAIKTSDYAEAMYKTAGVFDVFARWGDRPPLFKLTGADVEAKDEYLESMGLASTDWFVAMHARSSGYRPADDAYHSYRNVDVTTYTLAIDEIARRGGWCVRMGDPTMPRFPDHPRVIDYALSSRKSPQLDVALAASCRFFLGAASGLSALAQIFGRPCAFANMAPLSAVYGLNGADLSIPSRLRDPTGRILGLKEILDSPIADFRLSQEFSELGLETVRNTQTEILDLVTEMLDCLDGTAMYNEDDFMRETQFRSWFRNGHYSFGSIAGIGRDFLRQAMD